MSTHVSPPHTKHQHLVQNLWSFKNCTYNSQPNFFFLVNSLSIDLFNQSNPISITHPNRSHALVCNLGQLYTSLQGSICMCIDLHNQVFTCISKNISNLHFQRTKVYSTIGKVLIDITKTVVAGVPRTSIGNWPMEYWPNPIMDANTNRCDTCI